MLLAGLFSFFEDVRLAPIGVRHGEHLGRDLRIVDPARGRFSLYGLFAKILGWLDHHRTSVNSRVGLSGTIVEEPRRFQAAAISVGGGKDGPGVRPTALGSFAFRTKKTKNITAKNITRVGAGNFSLFATLQESVIAIDHFENARTFFGFHRRLSEHSTKRNRCGTLPEITHKVGNGIALKSLKPTVCPKPRKA
jgi:hypothetical protein